MFELRHDYAGEFARIKEALTTISTSPNTAMSSIYDSSLRVSLGSEQIADDGQLLASCTSEQAVSVDKLASTVNEMDEAIMENTSNANRANEKVTDVGQEIGKSSRKMNEMLAARTGEAGKGFAVVAQQVRELANKSAEAGKDTNALIALTLEAVASGVHIADDTAASLKYVVEGSDEVAGLINEISRSCNNQTKTVNQINQEISHISEVVRNNAEIAEESASSSEELSTQS